jgi:tetrahydromethanopterin S-methyltransferase subunit G
MSDEPTVLGMIDQRLERIENNQTENTTLLFQKIDSICTMQTDLRITDEVIKAKIAFVETLNARTNEELAKINKRLDEHERDREIHYNQYYNETIPQKIWRKKPEILAGGSVGVVAVAVIQFLIDKFGG